MPALSISLNYTVPNASGNVSAEVTAVMLFLRERGAELGTLNLYTSGGPSQLGAVSGGGSVAQQVSQAQNANDAQATVPTKPPKPPKAATVTKDAAPPPAPVASPPPPAEPPAPEPEEPSALDDDGGDVLGGAVAETAPKKTRADLVKMLTDYIAANGRPGNVRVNKIVVGYGFERLAAVPDEQVDELYHLAVKELAKDPS